MFLSHSGVKSQGLRAVVVKLPQIEKLPVETGEWKVITLYRSGAVSQ